MTDPVDAVVASYDIFLAPPTADTSNRPGCSVTQPSSAKLLVLQYPAYRPSSRPYNSAKSQKPSELRLKPNTGLVEVDVPIFTHEHYNEESGSRYGKALSDSRTLHGKSSHGLAGGFHTGSSQVSSLGDIPAYGDTNTRSPPLKTQTLGGKIAEPSERDPIYFLGSFKHDSIHLSHLDGVVQMRPQLHHLDAEEDINQKRFQVGGTGPIVKPKAVSEPGPSKLESRAIEIKLKDTKDDGRDRTLNENSRLLRDIQIDIWRSHSWVDQAQAPSHVVRNTLDDVSPARLRSSLSNGDWLDKMSAPREDGKKGLLAKLRGRERERARRKKAEEEKKQKSRASEAGLPPGTGPIMDQSSDSEASSADATDVEMERGADNIISGNMDVDMEDGIEIKEDPETLIGQSRVAGEHGGEPSTSKSTKKRGRPKKAQPPAPIEIDD